MVKMNLPNTMIIGASKSATTSLYDLLKNHENIFAPSFKEPHFFNFDDNFSKGLDWYSKTYFSRVRKEHIILDCTPTYLYSKNTPERIFNSLGNNMKFIVVVRNPVDRAYSHFLHSKRDGLEKLKFSEALENESSRLVEAQNNNDFLSELRFSYIAQGMYFNMLSNYLEFYSMDNFLILDFDYDIKNDFTSGLRKISKFLNLNISSINTGFHSNKSSKARFPFLKNILKSKGFFRRMAKKIVFSTQTRQRLKNKINRLNEKEHSFSKLSHELKSSLMRRYFNKDISLLESLINEQKNWNN